MLRQHLTYAKVASVLAISIAAGATADAAVRVSHNSVGARQLKARAVTHAKLAPDAITRAAVRRHGLRAADVDTSTADPGDIGPRGPQGAPGPPGPPSIARLDYVSSSFVLHAGDTASLSVPCGRTNLKVIGGGARITGVGTAFVTVLDSLP